MAQSRRDFITSSAGAAVSVAAGAAYAGDTFGGNSEVYVGTGTADKIIPKIFDKLGGIGKFVKPGSRVLIKPNMSFANPPEWGTTTSPEAVMTVASMCLQAGAKRVVICDNVLRDVTLCKTKTGIENAVKDLKGVILYVPKQPNQFVEKSEPKAVALKSTKIVKEAERADLLISLPTAKCHSAAGVSLGLKGQMGLIENRSAMHSEMDLHRAIAELQYYVPQRITIVDATRALLDNGPAGPGKVIPLNKFVGGTDIVAVDSFSVTLASWYGRTFEGKNVQHIKLAEELGFGNAESSKINVVGV